MASKLLPRFAGCLCLFLAATRTTSAQSTPTLEPPKSGFGVSVLPFTADDLAKELGYEFTGYTYRFTTPVYARLKITATPGDSALPKDPSRPLRPPYFIPLNGPCNEVTLRILKREEQEGPRGYVPTAIRLTYNVSLRGRKVEPEAASRLRAARAVFSDTLSDRFDYRDAGPASTVVTQRLEGGPSLSYMPASKGIGSGVLFPNEAALRKLADDFAQPGGEKRAADEKEKWQAFAEEKLLSGPTDVFHDVADMLSRDDKTVKQHAECAVAVEFSREPFLPTEGDPTTAAKPTLSPSPSARP